MNEKKIIFKTACLLLVFAVSFLGCKDKDKDEDEDDKLYSKVLLLQVDFQDYKFISGAEVLLETKKVERDTIPVSVTSYEPDGNNKGTIALIHKVSEKTFFEGTMYIKKEGEIITPKNFTANMERCEPINYFQYIENYWDVQNIFQLYTFEFQNVDSDILNWDNTFKLLASFQDIALVKKYLDQNCVLSLILYSPKVEDKSTWKWIAIFYV